MNDTYEGWIGRTAVDRDGQKIGTISDIYYDDNTGLPEWLTVKTGLLGTRSSFVPMQGAETSGEDLRLLYAKDKVKDAPNIDADGALSPDEERALYEYYGRGADLELGDVARRARGQVDEGRADDNRTDDNRTDGAMTRSEEELEVGTQRHESGRARLRKHVVTEQQSVTVPVKREEARVVREEITDANLGDALDGADISEDEHVVVLSEEEVVVDKKVVPKERVRLDKETVVDQEQVSDEVRKERIEVDGDLDDSRSGRH